MKRQRRLTEPTLEQTVARLHDEIDQVRRLAEGGDRELRGRIDELDRALGGRIRTESRAPALGLALIAAGVILSACANIVGA